VASRQELLAADGDASGGAVRNHIDMSSSPPGGKAVSEGIAALQARFRSEAEDRCRALEQSLGELLADGERAELLERLRSEAHMLKGAAGVLGFEALHRTAGRFEERIASLGPNAELGDALVAELKAGVAEVRSALPS
jgi:HPt (histidine-containing phosphotransfer) domain-containing protein